MAACAPRSVLDSDRQLEEFALLSDTASSSMTWCWLCDGWRSIWTSSAGTPPISVRFDANTASGMPWTFKPVHTSDSVQIGVRDLAFFTAKNNSSVPITGTATFNVEPEQAAPYFNKIQCFCFTEQTLQPGEEVRMPVLFYVDPAALDDPNMEGVEQITLSYTFHRKPPEDS